MYSGLDPTTPSFPFSISQCYCRPYFVIPFHLIAVHIIIIIIHSYNPNDVEVCVQKGDGHSGKRSHDESALFIPLTARTRPNRLSHLPGVI